MGCQKKNNGVGGLSVADVQAASAQIAEIQWAVGGPLVKPLEDLLGFVPASQLMYVIVDEMVLSC